MEKIRIDVGVNTALSIDCTQFDFTGVLKVVFTIKNDPSINAPVIVEREFIKPEKYNVIITPEESLAIGSNAVADINKILVDGRRYKISDNYNIVLRKGVGDAFE